ncbi:MAG: N-acetyl-gamma-glutamyl-phosphate reductase, partial [Proteobacteria bacterium]|nr:N-acetyl-gamma-glutamyl-phosphate reductase [Pseudomonadota bacterium]
MIRVAVIGATGYAGAELVRLLCNHPETELAVLTSRRYAGVEFDRVYPSMAGVVDLVCEELDVAGICEKSDVVFTALPHKLPMSIVPELIARGKKVVDFSADFRYRNPAIYEAFYQPHTARDMLEKAV